MKIVGFSRTATQDWDGTSACMIRLSGCNFRCPYCSSTDLVLASDSVSEISEDEIFGYINENDDFLKGVIISGGEPTADKDLFKLLKKIKSLGMKIKLDTNGYRPDVLDDLIGANYVDMISMDLKTSLTNERYSAATGTDTDVENIKRSISIIMDSGIDYEFRTVCVPSLVGPADIEDICRNIKGAKRYTLHQFTPKNCLNDSFRSIRPYRQSEIIKMADTAKKYVKNVRVKGL